MAECLTKCLAKKPAFADFFILPEYACVIIFCFLNPKKQQLKLKT